MAILVTSIFLYVISFACQLAAGTLCIRLIRKTTSSYKWGWGFLGAGLLIMLGRRLNPIYRAIESNNADLLDASLSAIISAFLLLGIIGIHKIIIQEKEGNDLLSTLSKMDLLTSCLSRHEIFFCISQEVQRVNRYDKGFAVAEIDIDHFKNVNDTYGHQVGDEVLKNLVHQIKTAIRSTDSVGRIGGEEFILLLSESDEISAIEACERIRSYVEQHPCLTTNGIEIFITISIGITIYNFIDNVNDGEGANIALMNLVNQADTALYRAKNSGRNKVALWDQTGCRCC